MFICLFGEFLVNTCEIHNDDDYMNESQYIHTHTHLPEHVYIRRYMNVFFFCIHSLICFFSHSLLLLNVGGINVCIENKEREICTTKKKKKFSSIKNKKFFFIQQLGSSSSNKNQKQFYLPWYICDYISHNKKCWWLSSANKLKGIHSFIHTTGKATGQVQFIQHFERQTTKQNETIESNTFCMCVLFVCDCWILFFISLCLWTKKKKKKKIQQFAVMI